MRTLLRLAVAWCLVTPAYAQSMAQAELTFLPWKGELSDYKVFWDTLTAARQEEDRRKINGTISLGFNGDKANGDSLFKLKTGASLSRSAYPSELRFSADLSMQVKGKEFQEDVTTLLANYDYNHYRYAQYYAFVERFTDSFLSIDQRYETGFGAMFGLHRMGLRTKAKALDAKLAALRFDPPRRETRLLSDPPVAPRLDGEALAVQGHLNALAHDASVRPSASVLRGRAVPTAADYANLLTAIDRLRETLVTKESRLFLGVAVSVFSELERAKIETTTRSGLKRTLPVDPTHKFRFTLRPTLIARPAEQLEVLVYPYFKYPLEGPWTTDGKVDYRFDLITATTWTLEKDTTGNESVAFTFKFERRYDNVPPAVSQTEIDASAADPLERVVARTTHYSTAIALTVKW